MNRIAPLNNNGLIVGLLSCVKIPVSGVGMLDSELGVSDFVLLSMGGILESPSVFSPGVSSGVSSGL